MKSAILLLALTVVVLSSCTTAYQTGQTPDDVYYSPARPQDEYVRVEKNNDRRYQGSDDYYEDRYLRMKVQNRNRWSDLDDWYVSERRYRYNIYTGYNLFSNPWNPQTYWNSYYNPYYSHCYTYSPNVKTVAYTKPRTFNLNTYTTTTTNTQRNNKTRNNHYYYNNNSNDRNSNSNSGNILRNIFNGNNSSSGSKVNTNTSSGNSGGGSGSSGSSGSSAPVRKF